MRSAKQTKNKQPLKGISHEEHRIYHRIGPRPVAIELVRIEAQMKTKQLVSLILATSLAMTGLSPAVDVFERAGASSTPFLPVSEPLFRPSCAPTVKSKFLAITSELVSITANPGGITETVTVRVLPAMTNSSQ